MSYIPRPYQIKSVENTLDLLFNHEDKNPIIALPTGTGKASVIAWTMRAILQRAPRARLFNVMHTKELVGQNASELQTIWPTAPYGIYAAALKSKQANMPITFGMIQSARKQVKAFGKQAAMLIDEAHLLSPEEESSYQLLINALREDNPKMPVIGYTATPWRMRHGLLTEGNIFNCTAIDLTQRDDFVQFIDDGYLVPLIPKKTSFIFDVSKVKKLAGDFNPGDLQRVMNVDEHTRAALNEALQVAHDRQHWMVFCSGIEHVEAVTTMLEMWGERAVCVHSKMPSTQRDLNIEAFKQGHARIIVNDGILTTGFNSPWVDCIVLLRPTNSPGLHIQILGRGTRPFYAPGYTREMLNVLALRLEAIERSTKQNCLVLDFSGNVARLGPVNDPRVPKKKGEGTGDVPVKICPVCDTYVHAAQRFCDGILDNGNKCTHEFLFETKIEQTAATTELIVRSEPNLQWFPVNNVEYEVKSKPFSPKMMRVKYYCGARRFTETVCVEHEGKARWFGREWWRKRLAATGVSAGPPPTTEEGMTFVDKLKKPTHICVNVNSSIKYPDIVAVSFDGTTPMYEPARPSHAQAA